MPRTLKRRADAISRDEASPSSAEESDAPPQRQQPRSTEQSAQHRPRRSTPASDASNTDASESDEPAPESQTQLKTAVKKLVRLALSSEYARQPLRRTDVNAKILKSDTGTTSSKVNFRAVFTGAQTVLRDVFGMELIDLPSRERVGLNDRRKAASQKAAAAAATQKEATQRPRDADEGDTQTGRKKDPVLSAQNWILVSCLPAPYKTRPDLLVPSRAPDEGLESAYVALYTIIISLLYLHTPSGVSQEIGNKENQGQGQTQQGEDSTEPISDAKLHRYLSRLNLVEWTPMGIEGANLDKLLARMLREGYVERRRDMSGGEEVVEWVVGPRGKREVGRSAVAGLVRGVYGFGVDGTGKGLEMPRDDDEEDNEEGRERRRRPVKMEKDELERRLKRTLGDVVALKIHNQGEQTSAEPEEEERRERAQSSGRRTRNAAEGGGPRRSGRRRRDDDDDDDDDE